MPEPLYPTPTRLALLADVAAGKVADDADGTPYLDLGGDGRAKVADAIWLMYRAGWLWQRDGSPVWALTDKGRAVLEAGAP
jgi:hypothetical protein